jgi:hypothetical protein
MPTPTLAGTVYGVVSDNDPDVDSRRDVVVNTGHAFVGGQPPAPSVARFLVRVRGRNADGSTTNINNAYVEILGAGDAFTDPYDGNPLPGDDDIRFVQSQLSKVIGVASQTVSGAAPFGCPVRVSQGYTNPSGARAAHAGHRGHGRDPPAELRCPDPGRRCVPEGRHLPATRRQGGHARRRRRGHVSMNVYAGRRGYGDHRARRAMRRVR